MKKIHPTQKKILEILKRHIEEPWTIRQLQEELNLSSTSVVHHHLKELEKKGYLKRNPASPTDYQVIDDSEKRIAYLNLYGLAECGPNGRLLDGNPIDRIPVSTKILGFPSEGAFLVRANGDSMQPKINEGDLIIALKSNDAPDGSVVVCVNEGKVLIKKLLKENNKIILKSYNENYQPFEANPDSFIIEGIVKSILSNSI